MTQIIGSDKFFKEAYVVNVAARTDRYAQFIQMIKDFDIGEVKRFEAIRNIADGAWGCAQSHLAIIRLAKEKQLDNILVFEDDALLVDNFNELIQPLITQLQTLNNWDFFYFGCRLIAPAVITTPNLAKIIGAYCTHAYVVRHTLYDKILQYDYSKDGPIDVYYSMITREHNSYCCVPICAYQRPGVSDLIGAFQDYRELFDWSYKEFVK